MNKTIQDQIDNYYNYKWWMHIIFDTDTREYLRVPHITFNVTVLENLKTIVESFTKNGYFRNNIKNNIYTLLGYAREYKDENYKERLQIVNEIISLLNKQFEDNSIEFYRYQLYSRTKNIKFLVCSSELISLNYDYVEQMLYDDFTILITHLKETTEQQFDEEYLIKFKDQHIYYENLNLILEECPYVFKDKTFCDRVTKVLKLNDKKEEYVKPNNRIIKKINKQVKKIKL